MSRSLCVLGALVVGVVLGAGAVRASSSDYVMDVAGTPGDQVASVSSVSNVGAYGRFEVGADLMERVQRAEEHTQTPEWNLRGVQLVLVAPAVVNHPELVVGSDAVSRMRQVAQEHAELVILEPRSDAAFLERMTVGPGEWEKLGEIFQVEMDERPWSTTTEVHVLAGRTGVVPYAAVAHEMDVWEDQQRLGIGAGAMVIFDKHSNFGAEVIRFNTDLGETVSKDTRFMARFEIEF